MSRPPLPLTDLSAAFRLRGEIVKDVSPEAARAFACCAEWLETSLAAALDKALTVEEARQESGWSYEGLRKKLSQTPSLNAAESGPPMIRRRDLPLLGAARGPRGPYPSRKPTARPHEVTSRLGDELLGAECTVSEAVPNSVDETLMTPAAPERVTVHEAHTHGLPQATLRGAAANPYPVEMESMALELDDDLEEPIVRPVGDRPKGERRSRTTQKRTRRGSSQDRFRELLALAAGS